MKFTEEHHWLREEDDVVVVGITEHAAAELGEVIFVDLPDIGDSVVKDEEVMVVESNETATDIMAPIDGEIVEVNDALTDEPSLVSEDAIGDGWLFKIEPSDPDQLDALLDEAAYTRTLR